ncbi:hypothetical protein SANTM175S_05738 [Streptomyces antimycoticus]
MIARVHPSLGDGPPLVHVDAYRLNGGLDEMEDLDLDVSLPDSVVAVEWGEGKVEGLAEDRLHVVIQRTVGSDMAVTDVMAADVDDVRDVVVTGVGPRSDVRLRAFGSGIDPSTAALKPNTTPPSEWKTTTCSTCTPSDPTPPLLREVTE